MRKAPRIAALLSALVLTAALAGPLAAADPQLISAKPFDVQVANGQVNVNFTLALSEVTTYPVTITAISGATEEVLYEGLLTEGAYRFSSALSKITGHGELKVVLRTRVTNRSEKGNQSYTVYLQWQGTM